MNEDPLILRKKQFVEAVYVRDFKNTYAKIITALELLRQKINPEEEKIVLAIINNNIPKLINLFRKNKKRIKSACRSYKELEKTEEYEIIYSIWIQNYNSIIAHLSELYRYSLKFNKNKTGLYDWIEKNYVEGSTLKNISKLLKRFQEVIYSYITQEERHYLDGM